MKTTNQIRLATIIALSALPVRAGAGTDHDNDNMDDIAFHRPGGGWGTVPILYGSGANAWRSSNLGVPGWANQPDVVALPGDYNADGRTDIAFHHPGPPPGRRLEQRPGPARRRHRRMDVQQLQRPGLGQRARRGRRAGRLQRHVPRYDPRDNVQDGGDVAYDWTPADATSFKSGFEAFAAGLRWPNSGPIIITPPVSAYEQLQDSLGMTGAYDGTFFNGISTARVFAVLRNHQGEAHGKVTALGTLRFEDGFCGDLELEEITLPIHLTTTGPTFPAPITQRSRFDGSGSTTREVSVLGLFSGQMVIDVDVTLFNMWPSLQDSWMTGSIEIDVPWPCQDQQVAIQLERRNQSLFSAFNYP